MTILDTRRMFTIFSIRQINNLVCKLKKPITLDGTDSRVEIQAEKKSGGRTKGYWQQCSRICRALLAVRSVGSSTMSLLWVQPTVRPTISPFSCEPSSRLTVTVIGLSPPQSAVIACIDQMHARMNLSTTLFRSLIFNFQFRALFVSNLSNSGRTSLKNTHEFATMFPLSRQCTTTS